MSHAVFICIILYKEKRFRHSFALDLCPLTRYSDRSDTTADLFIGSVWLIRVLGKNRTIVAPLWAFLLGCFELNCLYPDPS
jgi:hypothetical protein